MAKFVLYIFILFFTLCCNTDTNFHFERWDTHCSIQKGGRVDSVLIYSESYIVHGYEDNNNNIEMKIDSFFCEQISKLDENIDHYNLSIYKSSRRTNLENLEKQPNDYLYADLNDLIWTFQYIKKLEFFTKCKVVKYENKTYKKVPDCLNII